MKIDGNRPAHDTQATEGPRATDGARRLAKELGIQQGSSVAPGKTGDRVELSGDASMLAAAVRAANDAPPIRTELVERMRAKLNAGELGADSGKLADAIIDDFLK
jgi:flagellar biosynthesis anti-sigma factor FlgM